MTNRTILLGNLSYQCSARLQSQRRMNKGINAWRYRWMGVFPNQRISDDAGAWHGSEIAHVFGNIKSHSKSVPATTEQIRVSELMNNAWAIFAKDPENGLLKLGWPRYNENGKITYTRDYSLLIEMLQKILSSCWGKTTELVRHLRLVESLTRNAI
jgi:carboxylesterase type B